jgi:hypothetical protein
MSILLKLAEQEEEKKPGFFRRNKKKLLAGAGTLAALTAAGYGLNKFHKRTAGKGFNKTIPHPKGNRPSREYIQDIIDGPKKSNPLPDSVARARSAGVPEDKILKNIEDVDEFFTE